MLVCYSNIYHIKKNWDWYFITTKASCGFLDICLWLEKIIFSIQIKKNKNSLWLPILASNVPKAAITGSPIKENER